MRIFCSGNGLGKLTAKDLKDLGKLGDIRELLGIGDNIDHLCIVGVCRQDVRIFKNILGGGGAALESALFTDFLGLDELDELPRGVLVFAVVRNRPAPAAVVGVPAGSAWSGRQDL